MLYYAMHLELAPVTNRKRFMMLHNKDMEQITNQAVEAVSSFTSSCKPLRDVTGQES